MRRRRLRWPFLVVVLVGFAITILALSTSPALAPPARAPMLVWGTPIAHADRGACTDCHRVVSREGEGLPAITAVSPLPHDFRGVCHNCHAVKVSRVLGLLPAAAMPNPAGPSPMLGWLVARGLSLGADRE